MNSSVLPPTARRCNKNHQQRKKSVFVISVLVATLAACSGRDEETSAEDSVIFAPEVFPIPERPVVSVLQAAMSTGQLDAVRLTSHYLERIRELNPELHAIIEVNPDALEIAAALDAERLEGRVRSPLHGIPVLLKDNIDTADAMKTTAGSLALLEAPSPQRDAFVVQKLREAGAVILGKTNMSEWANFRSRHSTAGWSARGGQTRNAFDIGASPCGSSAGSAVAMAADLSVLAVGTETNGSIICPAANNGVVGIKPTVGLLSRNGIIPIAHSQDTAGPMARTVTDAATMLTVMTGVDPGDAITGLYNVPYTDYRFALTRGGLRGKRIGVMRHLSGTNADVDALLEQKLELMRAAGAILVDVYPQIPEDLGRLEFQVLLHEFKFGVNRYLETRGGPYRNLTALIEFNERNADRQMPHFGQDIFVSADQVGDLSSPEYLEALRYIKSSSQGLINGLLENESLHALMAPSNGPVWQIDFLKGDNPSEVNYVSSANLAAIAGYPNITVPAGTINGMPVGVSFMGPAFSEMELISIAFDFEQHNLGR